jgi:hypothetical protein
LILMSPAAIPPRPDHASLIRPSDSVTVSGGAPSAGIAIDTSRTFAVSDVQSTSIPPDRHGSAERLREARLETRGQPALTSETVLRLCHGPCRSSEPRPVRRPQQGGMLTRLLSRPATRST